MKRRRYHVIYGIILLIGAVILLYPLLWLFSSTFRENQAIFTETGLLPSSPTLSGWKAACSDYGGQINLLSAMANTYAYVLPKVVLTLISVTLTAYGFSRFQFKGKRIWMLLLFSTLFLPQTVLYVPQYVLFERLGWLDSPLYLPLIVPAALAGETVFIITLMQFFRSIPKQFDEAARLDGCNSLQILWHILVPMLRPALISCGVLQLLWSVNDYMGPLLYIKTPSRYPLSIFVKLSMDADSGFQWNRALAVCCIAMLPQILVYFIAQRTTDSPIATGGIKG